MRRHTRLQGDWRSEEHTSELQSPCNLVCRLIRSEEHTSELQSPCNLVCRLIRSEEHTSELQSPCNLVCRLLLEKKKNRIHSGHLLWAWCFWRRPQCALTRQPSLAGPPPVQSILGHPAGWFGLFFFFFFNDTAPPEIYPLPLHAALPIKTAVPVSVNASRLRYWPPPGSCCSRRVHFRIGSTARSFSPPTSSLIAITV